MSDNASDVMDRTIEDQFAQAVSLVDANRFDEAEKLLTSLTATRPELPTVQVKLGYVYWEQGNLAKAIGCFRKATQLAPTSETASLGLFHCLWKSDQCEEALDEMKRFQSIGDSEDYRNIIRELNATT